MQATLTNVNDNSLFNAKRKKEFLEDMVSTGTIKERTSISYARIFTEIKELEEKHFKKDLAEFDLNQLEKVFHSFESKNRNTIESYGRIVSSYLNWNVKQGYIKENLLSTFKPVDFEKYLHNNEVYITERELTRYEGRCNNFQDAVIMRLLFEGLGGKELSQLRNIKKTDVDAENNGIILPGKNGKYEFFPVSARTIFLLEKAAEETIYYKRNGDINRTDSDNVRDYTDLIDNQYVLRPSLIRTENFNAPVDKFVLYRRLDSLSRITGIENLTAKFIQRSGMIHYANQLMKDGELTLQDMKDVAERFGVKSYHNLKGFLTAENIQKVYGEG